MKKHFKYTAAAVSAVTMIMSSVPAMAGSLTEIKDETKDNNGGHKVEVIVNDNKKDEAETKTEDKNAEEVTETEETTEVKETTETEETQKTEEPEKASETQETENTEEAEAETVGYSVLDGKIKEVTVNEDGSARISVETETRGEIIFNEMTDCMVIADNTVKTFADLAVDMQVSVVMKDNSPMTMSLPPQTSGAVAFVVKGETPSSVVVDEFNEELTGKTLKLNIDESVQILDIRGTKQILTAEDVKGSKAIVIYGASTKSIPAQTTPYMVIVLNEEEAVVQPEETVKTLPLREAVDGLGYEIKWTSNEEPIILTNGEKTVEIEINSDTITIDGDMVQEISSDVVIIDGVTYIPSDVVDLLK